MPLDQIHSADQRAAPEAAPSGQQAILWHSLERIPEIIASACAFYREHQSVEAVAQELDFITAALERMNPGKAFTFGVLAALPITLASAKAATLTAAAAKGGPRPLPM